VVERRCFDYKHEEFRSRFRRFVEEEVIPHDRDWRELGVVDRNLFKKAGDAGFLGLRMPQEFGGSADSDFRLSQIMLEESELSGVGSAVSGLGLHNDMVLPYFARYATAEQAQRWFPGLVSGVLIAAIAITEPGAGSDIGGIVTTAARHGDGFIVNGAKTLIGNGINADLVVTAARAPDSSGRNGISLVVVERGMPGFERGANLPKIGRLSQDTAELFFSNVEVSERNLLGQEGRGFEQLMVGLPLERLNIAVASLAAAQYSYRLTLDYVRARRAFGKSLGELQNVRFAFAEMRTELEIGQVFVDRCVESVNDGQLTPEEAAMAKWWCTELQKRVNDTCLQLHGGHGYAGDNPISWAWRDGRVTTIYGGTTEIMKEIIGRDTIR
jgi:alkylation response protein AidB-like acyl-CoA dehydrogenase